MGSAQPMDRFYSIPFSSVLLFPISEFFFLAPLPCSQALHEQRWTLFHSSIYGGWTALRPRWCWLLVLVLASLPRRAPLLRSAREKMSTTKRDGSGLAVDVSFIIGFPHRSVEGWFAARGEQATIFYSQSAAIPTVCLPFLAGNGKREGVSE